MTRAKRRLIFYALILVFIIAAPATILYAAGYSFDWQKKQVIKTGAFYLDALPEGGSIYIDGEQRGTVPAFINRLTPGKYQIEIKKDGYANWKKNLEIQSQLTSEARNILFVLKSPTISNVAEDVYSISDYFSTSQQKQTKEQASSTIARLADIEAWTLQENTIYYLQKSNLILYEADVYGLDKKQISFEPLPLSEKGYQIKSLASEIIVFEQGGKLYLLDKDTNAFKLLADDVLSAEISPDGKKILYWNEHEVFVFWLKEILVQPNRKAGDKELIDRYSNKIKQAIWLETTNEHIIYIVSGDNGQDQIKITELDSRDARNTYDIYSGAVSEISFNAKDKLLYILDNQTKLYSVDLWGK
ncbi:MAG: PEGA domain-containing protein [Candidatus Portnoybacteria bacterium]|nr:PEGA domain-containing protein [Candidatus Portnoybacteria bacterium]